MEAILELFCEAKGDPLWVDRKEEDMRERKETNKGKNKQMRD